MGLTDICPTCGSDDPKKDRIEAPKRRTVRRCMNPWHKQEREVVNKTRVEFVLKSGDVINVKQHGRPKDVSFNIFAEALQTDNHSWLNLSAADGETFVLILKEHISAMLFFKE